MRRWQAKRRIVKLSAEADQASSSAGSKGRLGYRRDDAGVA